MKRAVASMLVVLTVLLATVANADDFKRERGEGEEYADRNKAKNALENMNPPALAVTNWQNTDGKELTLAALKGKVIVLDFWGVWCGPCRSAMPHLKELYEKHKDKGLVVIGIHTKSQGEKMADYVVEAGLTWPIALDTEGDTVKAFAVDSFPDYYLIDRKGNLRVADLANSDLDRAVESLLDEK